MTELGLELVRELLRDRATDMAAEDLLYARWYHRTGTAIHVMPPPGAYSAAVLWPERFEAGWTVRRTGVAGFAAAAEVERRDDRLIVAPPNLYPEAAGVLALQTGMAVRVNPLTGFLADGYWHLFSPSWRRDGAEQDRHRLYFSVRRGAELKFVRTFAKVADWHTKWSLKILCGPGLDGRCDTAVAYLPRALGTSSGWVAALIDRVAPLVAGEGPPLTLELRSGIHLAPEIETDRSFGQLLCAALIDAAGDGAVLSDPKGWRIRAQSALDEVLARGRIG